MKIAVNQWAARQSVTFDTCDFADYVFFRCANIVREDIELQRLFLMWTGGKNEKNI
jgi:hypothetical protein